jgi:hypothetical protein
VDKSTKKDGHTSRQDAEEGDQTNDRRRLGRIVHDDRGNASVEWHDAPSDFERQKFEIESATGTFRRLKVPDGLSVEGQNNFDPYASSRPVERKSPKTGTTSRTDLRKLSEWIKMKRELEERKLRGDADGDTEDKD